MGPRSAVNITPADVGRRVSVRSRLPQGKGPRFTDTLGVLRSWSEGVVVVERRDGSLHRLEENAVVAAKVVPAPPPRRRG